MGSGVCNRAEEGYCSRMPGSHYTTYILCFWINETMTFMADFSAFLMENGHGDGKIIELEKLGKSHGIL